MPADTKEYELYRQEVLRYLEEFQTIRNMMYAITSVILVICLKGENTESYSYLFYEDTPGFPIK